MVYIAAGFAFIVTFLLLAAGSENQLPFIITLILLVVMISLRSYLHFKDEDHLEALLDVILSLLLTVVSVVFLISTLLTAHFYVDAWSDFLNPQVLIYVGLNLVLLIPFVILSLLSLINALRDL